MSSTTIYTGSSDKTNVKVVPDFYLHNKDGDNDNVTFRIVFGNSEATNTLNFDLVSLTESIKLMNFTQRNENLLLEVVRNYVRKNNFSDLNDALEDEMLSEDDYNNELSSHSDKYAVTLKNLHLHSDIENIIYLTERIGANLREFTLSEVSEMFSVKESQLILFAQRKLLQIK